MDAIPGFTKKQIKWFFRRDGGQCCFFVWKKTKWVRCQNTADIDVHHIIPVDWTASHHLIHLAVNGPTNGICLCGTHCVGYQAGGEYRYVVYPDVEAARLVYGDDKDAFSKMRAKRAMLNRQGIPYWNTAWDWMFQRWARRYTLAYLHQHPEDPYPEHRDRDRRGHSKS